jgi:hypothetical protein
MYEHIKQRTENEGVLNFKSLVNIIKEFFGLVIPSAIYEKLETLFTWTMDRISTMLQFHSFKHLIDGNNGDYIPPSEVLGSIAIKAWLMNSIFCFVLFAIGYKLPNAVIIQGTHMLTAYIQTVLQSNYVTSMGTHAFLIGLVSVVTTLSFALFRYIGQKSVLLVKNSIQTIGNTAVNSTFQFLEDFFGIPLLTERGYSWDLMGSCFCIGLLINVYKSFDEYLNGKENTQKLLLKLSVNNKKLEEALNEIKTLDKSINALKEESKLFYSQNQIEKASSELEKCKRLIVKKQSLKKEIREILNEITEIGNKVYMKKAILVDPSKNAHIPLHFEDLESLATDPRFNRILNV